jgi:hypothetical protein
MKRLVAFAATMLAVTALAGAALAETVALKADLKGSSSVPPNQSAATGKVEASFDTATKVLTYTVTFSGLSGPAVAAHFHGPAEVGKNAGIVVHFPAVSSPVKGTATLTDAQAADLLAGRWYANIHTQQIPSGEIRGQLTK